jgi:hypothetical protein
MGEEVPGEEANTANSPRDRSQSLPSLISEDLLFILAVYGLSRLFYLVAGALSASYLPPGSFHTHTPDVPFGTLNIWAHWDGIWYSEIAADGYGGRAPASTSFFPLYPLLMRSFAELFGGPLSLGTLSMWGVLISLLALPFAFYFVYRIAEDNWGTRVAKVTILTLAFFPTTFFFNAAYTESLFLALSAASLWAARVRKNLLLACALAAFASATRSVGVFLVVPLFYEWLKEGAGKSSYGWWRGTACLTLASSGLLLYAGYLWSRFGNPFLFYSMQESYWNRKLTDPLTTLRQLAGHLGTTHNVYDLIFLGLALALLLVGLRVLPLGLYAYAFLLVLPSAFYGTPQGPLIGLPRYMLVAFPMFIVLGSLLKSRPILDGWLVVSVASSLTLCALFVSWRFVA